MHWHAGTIALTQTGGFGSSDLDLATLSASGDTTGSGNGNSITISDVQALTVDNTKMLANGGGTAGDSGSVTISGSGTPVDFSTARIEARSDTQSGTSGAGGTVTLDNAIGSIGGNTAINVPTIVHVNGGTSIGTSDFDGKISINGVTCQQWKTAAATYPKTGWDCITPDTGASISTLVSAGTSLSGTLQGQLASLPPGTGVAPSVGLYAMPSLLEYEHFFDVPHVGGYDTIYGTSYVSYLRVSMPFSYSSNGDNATISGSPTIMVGALIHELGHEFDYMWGPGLQNLSAQTSWTSNKSSAFASMDALPCNQVFYLTTCTLYLGSGLSNSQIFDIRFSGIGHVNGELFAAMFAHVQGGLTGTPPSYQQDPELEMALDTLTALKSAMSALISSPPTPVK